MCYSSYVATRTFQGREYRVIIDEDERARVESRRGGGKWELTSGQSLLRFAVDSALWGWLKEQGYKRPPPSGPTPSEDERSNVQVKLRLSKEDASKLKTFAEEGNTTQSGLVSSWISRAEKGEI